MCEVKAQTTASLVDIQTWHATDGYERIDVQLPDMNMGGDWWTRIKVYREDGTLVNETKQYLKDYHVCTSAVSSCSLVDGATLYFPGNTSWPHSYYRFHGTDAELRARGLPYRIKVKAFNLDGSPYSNFSNVIELGEAPTAAPPTYQCGNEDCSKKMYDVKPVDLTHNAEEICVTNGWGHCAICDVGYGPSTIHGWKPDSGSWSNTCPGNQLASFNPTKMEVCCMSIPQTPTPTISPTAVPPLSPSWVQCLGNYTNCDDFCGSRGQVCSNSCTGFGGCTGSGNGYNQAESWAMNGSLCWNQGLCNKKIESPTASYNQTFPYLCEARFNANCCCGAAPPTYQCGNEDCSKKMYDVKPVDLTHNAEEICVTNGWGHCAICDVGYGPSTIHGWKPDSGSWSNTCPGNQLASFNPTKMEVCCMSIPQTPTPTVNLCPLISQGDANCDQSVTEDDYSVFKSKMLGQPICASCSADFNNDNKVDLLDYEVWRNTVFH